MQACKNKEPGARLGALRQLLFDRPVGEQKYEEIQSDEGEGDDGLPSTAHILVAQRDEHGILRG
jgi:hypothetical protein